MFTSRSLRGGLAAAFIMLASTGAARAELKVRSPTVTLGEIEFEQNGLLTFDRKRSALNNGQSDTFELGYGVTPYWEVEIEAETAAGPDSNVRLVARTLESTFQLLPQGKYWLDAGVFVEAVNAVLPGEPNELTFGPLLQKEFAGPFAVGSLATANILMTREFGHNSANRTGLFGAFQYLLLLHPLFQPGAEVYLDLNDVGRVGRFDTQQLFAGPAFTGSFLLHAFNLPGAIKYEAGYLFGATGESASGAVRWRLEYEVAF